MRLWRSQLLSLLLFTLWELILRLVFSDTECSDEQNSNHGLDHWTSEYSESVVSFSNTTRILRAGGTINSQLKQTEFLTSKTSRKTNQNRTYRNQRFLLHKKYVALYCWILYRVFMSINLISILKLFPSVAIFWTSVHYFLVPLSWAGVTLVETIIFIWYWCSSLSVINRSIVGWKRSLFACK